MMSTVIPTLNLYRTPFGKLALTDASGTVHEGVQPVRAFPVKAPEHGISLLNADGKEVAWIDALAAVPEPAQTLLREELVQREFMPVIERIDSVSSYATPSTWTVQTDRGMTSFVLKGEEDIRRLGHHNALLIADAHGIQYLVRDQFALDAHSKRILDRFF
ncbi:DUF1854 domain-containing protein [Curvibacter sp. CHRR-16]|uniref:cyanophycin metabolism-associated DUF1854 family protein n=1 Tax=Curvibacter sp. CHRR-16 TaxID=2835872 RepID=UPI001BD91C41|nr:DUF1854 domain-containing protein [Curvibacter sp. CHRR-16]MBT0568830.1 DUF1854 domain-containing protein [Curvibacter sp. CHRR-16]